MLAMAAVALVLVALGTITRGGFSTMVDYLSPVYWLFLTLSATAGPKVAAPAAPAAAPKTRAKRSGGRAAAR